MDTALRARIEAANREVTNLVPYDPAWPRLFEEEASFLRTLTPSDIIRRIAHFGSTAVPGLAAKPIVDMVVEVTNLDAVKTHFVLPLQTKGYEYFWRPTTGDETAFYAWFIKRNTRGQRTHHIHMVEANSQLWDRLYFRDYLRAFPEEARRYAALKRELAAQYPHDRTAYTLGKSSYVRRITDTAKHYFYPNPA